METWKDIKGFEGLYQISSYGNVKSLERKRKLPQGTFVKIEESIMRKSNVRGYSYTKLSKDSVKHTFKIHRLVAQHFIPNLDGKEQVNHINGIKNDNRVENLEWNTSNENMKHAFDTGLLTMPDNRGEKNGRSKLNRDKVAEIRSIYPEKSYSQLSEIYGVSKTIIAKVVKNQLWVS